MPRPKRRPCGGSPPPTDLAPGLDRSAAGRAEACCHKPSGCRPAASLSRCASTQRMARSRRWQGADRTPWPRSRGPRCSPRPPGPADARPDHGRIFARGVDAALDGPGLATVGHAGTAPPPGGGGAAQRGGGGGLHRSGPDAPGARVALRTGRQAGDAGCDRQAPFGVRDGVLKYVGVAVRPTRIAIGRPAACSRVRVATAADARQGRVRQSSAITSPDRSASSASRPSCAAFRATSDPERPGGRSKGHAGLYRRRRRQDCRHSTRQPRGG